MSDSNIDPKKINPERLNCPFYGFTSGLGSMLDSEGNCCGLVHEDISCRMKSYDSTPCWQECLLNSDDNKKVLSQKLSTMKITPKELRPDSESLPKGESWQGVPLQEWYDAFQQR